MRILNKEKQEQLQTKIKQRKEKFVEAIKSIDPKFQLECKKFFEKYFLPIYLGGKLEIKVIIDANIIISETLVYIKKNESFLLKLMESPFVIFIAPSYLKEELDEKIPELAKKKEIKERKLKKTIKRFLSKIKFVNKIEDKSYILANEKIGNRDRKDVPYLGLFFSIKAHAILSKDHDFQGIQKVRIWDRAGIPGKFVSVLQEGSISFYILANSFNLLIKMLFEILLFLMKSLKYFAKTIADGINWIINDGFQFISKIPDWVRLILGIGLITLAIWEMENRLIINSLKDITKRIKNTLSNFYNLLKTLLDKFGPIITDELIIWGNLFLEQINNTIDAYKELNTIFE